jgi:hypothetical protein
VREDHFNGDLEAPPSFIARIRCRLGSSSYGANLDRRDFNLTTALVLGHDIFSCLSSIDNRGLAACASTVQIDRNLLSTAHKLSVYEYRASLESCRQVPLQRGSSSATRNG